MLSESPYIFKRSYQNGDYSDTVVAGLDMEAGSKTISVDGIFENGTQLKDYYSDTTVEVVDGQVTVDSEFGLVLLGK